ncbi:hypothetical protein OS493_010395 [Desmophyllum pertusum]|uniref:Integrase catalytic domain-containing protein n=1 Tax=Desmophyllum pertusum TaxID=174260 RepID=A0A9X0A475_9CNID|nr:hypothetical protein OS493_010395 [Desmophyllum pertusum]
MAARHRSSRVVLRERNERGFALFLRNLKSVLNILVNIGEQELETDILIETRCRLVDASGTLSFLMSDIESGVTNATGLPSSALRDPVQNLKLSLTQLIALLSNESESRNNADFYDALDVSYSAPLNLAQPGRGRKRYEITKDQVEHLRSLYFSWEAIAGILQVSVSTLQRRRKEFGLSDSVSTYSDISDDELDEIYKSITGSSTTGLLNTPNIGRRRFIGALRSRGLNVQRWRISECLRRVDPVGTALRWRMTIHRRKYYVPTPNSLWHIDSGHKLIRYKLITHVCIDGKTRLILYAACRNNNKAETVLSLFQNAVQGWGLPSRVRSDYGMENYHVAAYMMQHRGPGRGSIITGSSVHNSRVERTHRDVYSGVLVFYARIFGQLEDEGNLDVLDDLHIFSLHHVYIPRIQNSLEELKPVTTSNVGEGYAAKLPFWTYCIERDRN